ncbi:MAG: sigma-54-dependent transcriptional regulator, partial [Planctomycetota bacterium]
MTAPSIPSSPSLIHVVDDEPGICRALERYLGRGGNTIETFARAEDSLEAASRATPDLVILDVRLPGMTGLEALERFAGFSTPPSVIMVTAHGTLDIAVEALRRGAADYLPKPLDLDRIGEIVVRVLEQRRHESAVAPAEGERPLLVGRSTGMQELFKQIATVSMSDVPVLVLGESGTGKEGVARAIHRASSSAGGPFEAVDCASLPESLFEGELFGHERGAFTGAVQQRIGRLERADGGTLFLDEVAEIPPATQAKLLRFLEER